MNEEEEDPFDLTLPAKFNYPLPEGVDPMEHISSEIERAKEEGGIVFDNANALTHVPGHSVTCTCIDCREATPAMGDVGEQHDCTCLDCRSIWLSKEKQGPGHFGSRFGPQDSVIRVFKGEYDTPDAIFLPDVIEVDCDAGWAIRVREPIHICRNCWKGYCCWRDRGEFSVVGIPIPTLTTEENLDLPLCSECGHHHSNASAHGTTTLTQS
jgi:hypothetical protein